MRKWLVRLAALGVALLVAGQGQLALAQSPSAGKKIVRVGATQAVDSMNPFLAVRLVSTSIHRWMYGFLTVPDSKTLQPSPDLAESWTTSDDGLTWTFKIRETKWSDGRPVTAEDAAWTFNKIMTDDAAKTANGPAVENFETVTASGQELTIKLKAPQASMLDNPIPIMPKHVWEKVTNLADFTGDEYPAVTSGPYIAVEHQKDQFVKLKANPGYWRGAPKIDELQVVFYDNPAASIIGLKNGEIDLIGRLNPPDFQALQGDANIVQWNKQGRRAAYLQINHGATTTDDKPVGDGHPALKDQKVRQALHYAIDKQKLVDEVQNGLAKPADGSIVPPMYTDFFWEASGDTKVTYDVAKANKILDDAGYKKGADGVRTMPDGGKKLEFRFSIHTDTPIEDKLGEYLAGFFKEIGITLTTKKVEPSKFSEETGVTGLFDIAISGWSVNPDPEEVLATHLCSRRPTPAGEGGGTESFYCDDTFEKLYKEQLKELDRPKRAELIKQMQERLYTDAPVIAIYYPNDLEGYRKDRIKSITSIPEADGILYGGSSFWPFYSLEAVEQPASASAEGGSNTGLIAGVVGGVVVLGLAGFFLMRRRKSVADDRE
ncbi:ABC transporter substrate-binding protein [Nonomuraea glycinis]|uniref:Peptide ABC transporter substrate-binding protein n=1 Tax=Nonomuraea glycinis TaxID=2047744 RepID=A0A918EAF2_9ACTN|nr:ABC transporter substrate-binding protein [Nonomuraea glycinis]MCA2182831.1 ABC transporter substrate-binding protein [Nonomuraea glycinis]GGP17109.1 peptide ABC transporter substrate-binding protein [Nonomuraea glycinis]